MRPCDRAPNLRRFWREEYIGDRRLAAGVNFWSRGVYLDLRFLFQRIYQSDPMAVGPLYIRCVNCFEMSPHDGGLTADVCRISCRLPL